MALQYLLMRHFDTYTKRLLNDTIRFCLIQLAESVGHLSKDSKLKYPSIPWGFIAGFGNGIVHDYGKADHTVACGIVTKDLKDLRDSSIETDAAIDFR